MCKGLANTRLRQTGTFILAMILVTTGSFIRQRARDQESELDWLVLVQIALALAAIFLGVLLIRRHSLGGLGARVLVAYLLAILTSAFFSPYLLTVLGYWILLAGTSLLCIGLVSSCPNEDSLRRLENLIFVTLSFMLLKDTLIDAFYFRLQVDRMEELGIDMYRFGMGSTSAGARGLLAAIAFCMSFKTASEKSAASVWRFFWSGLFATVVLLTRTRIALAALLGSAVVRWWFIHQQPRVFRSHAVLVSAPCIAGSVLLLVAMGWLAGVPLIADTIQFVNRGQDSDAVMSVTGRTDVWPYAIKRILEGPIQTVFGHGYGVSKSVLNENNWGATFVAYHAHNTFLEVILSTGMLGALPFVVLIAYSLKWFTRFSWLLQAFSLGFTLRAITVVSVALSSTMTESELAVKIGPILTVYLFYVLSLDRQTAFLQASELQTRS